MFGMGPMEMAVIALLVILLFGAKRLPELAKSVGKSIKEFRHATQGLREELDLNKIDEPPVRPQSSSTADSGSSKSE